jgi:hypothetical protein
MGKTSDYYKANPKAKVKHKKTSAKAQRKPAAVKKRVQANRFNKSHGRKGDGMDASHGRSGIRMESASKNRARGGGRKK